MSFGMSSSSTVALLLLYLLPPIISVTPTKSIDDNQKNSISNSWQEFLWEQQDHSRHKKNVDSAESEISTVGKTRKEEENTSDPPTTTIGSPAQVNLGGYELKGEGDGGILMEYICMPEPGPCPTLKSYHMYAREPEEAFYPPWSYHGFSPPSEWHNVPIKYFEEPPLRIADEKENYIIRKHGSAMHLCTEEITDNVEKCKSRMKNECINSMPSPINILSKEAVEDGQLGEFDFINYNVFFGFEMFLETDGTQLLFAKVLSQGKRKPGIRGGSLAPDTTELFLDRIIFRLGFDYHRGSEHSLDGNFFGMEIQFFFTADDLPYWQALGRYKLLPADDSRIGQQVHVISLFVNVTDNDEEDTPDGSPFAGNSMEVLSLAAEMFWKPVNKNSSSLVRVTKKVFTLEDLFSEPIRGIYYTYQGSLSHPPCLTHVGWTVFEKPIWIKHAQWKRFMYVHAEFSDYRFLLGNIRPQNRIEVKADIEMYRKMKYVEGYGTLRQTELDEAAENTRLPITRGSISDDNNNNDTDSNEIFSPEPLYLIRKYVDYVKYFAQQVRKSKHGGVASSRDLYEYYDVDDKRRSSATTFHHYHYYYHFQILVGSWCSVARGG